MPFLLKKLLSQLLDPIALLFVCLCMGAFFAYRKRHLRLSYLLSATTALVALSGYPLLPDLMLSGLESKFPPYTHQTPGAKWVLVLGHGFSDDPGIAESSRIDGVMHARLSEALYILRKSNATTVVVSLAGPAERRAKEVWWDAWCESVSLQGCDSILITEALDTNDELRLALGHIGTNSFVLVTSAAHMHRAMSIALAAGGTPVPAPCNHLVSDQQPLYPHLLPSVRNVERMETALHEYIGLLWHRFASLFNEC
jgi:hypothetical protein